MNHLLCVMKVFQKFKMLKIRKQAQLHDEMGIGQGLGTHTATTNANTNANTSTNSTSNAVDKAARKAAAEDKEIEALLARRQRFFLSEADENGKGHARDVSEHEPLFLGIGTGARDDFHMDEASPHANIVADSPTAVDYNVYDRAYLAAVEERLRSNPRSRPTMYLTRFVKEHDHLMNLGGVDMEPQSGIAAPPVASKLADLVARVDVGDSAEKGEVVLRGD